MGDGELIKVLIGAIIILGGTIAFLFLYLRKLTQLMLKREVDYSRHIEKKDDGYRKDLTALIEELSNGQEELAKVIIAETECKRAQIKLIDNLRVSNDYLKIEIIQLRMQCKNKEGNIDEHN